MTSFSPTWRRIFISSTSRVQGAGMLSFSGQGFVVVQPSEEAPASFVGGSGGGQQVGSEASAAGQILGNFLGR